MATTLAQYIHYLEDIINRCKYATTGFKLKSVTINVLFILVVRILILILGGDVEINPSPVSIVCKHLNMCHVNIRKGNRDNF